MNVPSKDGADTGFLATIYVKLSEHARDNSSMQSRITDLNLPHTVPHDMDEQQILNTYI